MSVLHRFRWARSNVLRHRQPVALRFAHPCRHFSRVTLSHLLGARQRYVLKHIDRFRYIGEVIGHVAYAIGTATYFCTDMMMIRRGLILSSFTIIAFQCCYPAPQYLTMCWQVAYIIINSYQLAQLLGETPLPLTWEEAELHSLFSCRFLTESEVQPIMARGEWQWLIHGACLVEESSAVAPDRVFMITTGVCEASIAGNKVAELGPGSIVGEVALFSENVLAVHAMTVKAQGPVRCLAIPVAALRELFEGKPELKAKVERLFLNSLAASYSLICMEIPQQRYRAVMQAASDVGCKSAGAVAVFRNAHAIPEDMHNTLLQDEVPLSAQEEFRKELSKLQVTWEEFQEVEQQQEQQQQQSNEKLQSTEASSVSHSATLRLNANSHLRDGSSPSLA